MKTVKLILDMHEPNKNRDDKKILHPVTIYKNNENNGRIVRPEKKDSKKLQEFLRLNNPNFSETHYYIHLDIKLDYPISRTFQEMSFPN